jgi:hypothetical protein
VRGDAVNWFIWNACFYGLLFVGFLGMEAQRQWHGGTLPVGPRYIHRMGGVLLLAWPLALGIGSGNQMTAGEEITTAVTPFALLILFCLHMALREEWRAWFARRDRERE